MVFIHEDDIRVFGTMTQEQWENWLDSGDSHGGHIKSLLVALREAFPLYKSCHHTDFVFPVLDFAVGSLQSPVYSSRTMQVAHYVSANVTHAVRCPISWDTHVDWSEAELARGYPTTRVVDECSFPHVMAGGHVMRWVGHFPPVASPDFVWRTDESVTGLDCRPSSIKTDVFLR
ncbi:hypothetical protein EDB85DRAFT_1891867 [Lactarius pseudohatsudake]|nr:hypothetical protein EDB85DRAFT_1891867 [Lactarius pseudohatsudake]